MACCGSIKTWIDITFKTSLERSGISSTMFADDNRFLLSWLYAYCYRPWRHFVWMTLQTWSIVDWHWPWQWLILYNTKQSIMMWLLVVSGMYMQSCTCANTQVGYQLGVNMCAESYSMYGVISSAVHFSWVLNKKLNLKMPCLWINGIYIIQYKLHNGGRNGKGRRFYQFEPASKTPTYLVVTPAADELGNIW